MRCAARRPRGTADRVRRRRAGEGRADEGSCCPTRPTRRGAASRRRCRRRSRSRSRTRSFPITTSMSGKPTVAKLGVKPGFKVALLGSPKGFADTLKPLPAKVTLHGAPGADADLFLCFVADRARAARAPARAARRRRSPDALADLAEEGLGREVRPRRQRRPRRPASRAGWVDFKVCSVDDTWSGLAFKRRK